MVESALSPGVVGAMDSWHEVPTRAFRLMLLARVLDDKFASLYRMGKIHGGVFLGRGQEALSVASGLALRKGDVFAPLIRDAGRTAGLWRTDPGCRAHLSGLGAWADARARRQRSSRQAQGRALCP